MKFELPGNTTPILCQGITSSLGATHTEMSIVYGTRIIAGIAREKGLNSFLNVPTFPSVKEAVRKFHPQMSIIFSTPARALAEVEEAARAKIPQIICTTEHVPLHDQLKMKEIAEKHGVCLLGPSSPGLVVVDKCLAGTMPAHLFPKGNIGIVSRSSSLTYEAVQQIGACNLGVHACVALGTAAILGTSFIPVVQSFLEDSKVRAILLIGEMLGNYEFELAGWYKTQKKRKPLVVYIGGRSFTRSKKNPLLGRTNPFPADTIAAKFEALRAVGATIVSSVQDIGPTLDNLLKKE